MHFVKATSVINAFRCFAAVCCLVLLFVGICSAFKPRRELSLRGKIEQIVVEGETSSFQYVLAANNGERYQLITSQALAEYAHQEVTVAGTSVADNKFIVNNQIKAEKTKIAELPAPTFGSRKVLVLLVNFPDMQTQPLSVEQARAKVFKNATSPNEYFRAASLNRYSLTGIQREDGDVFGWLTIPISSSNCHLATTEWTRLADMAAQDNGINVLNYNSIIYVFSRAICGAEAYGTLGQIGNPNTNERSWFSASSFTNTGILIHELGHNLGLEHANGIYCNDTNIPNNCRVLEYGDPFDPMGGTILFFFNNHYRLALGWLSGQIQTVTTSGDYTLFAPSLPSKSSQILLVPLKDKTGQLTAYDYVLEFRRPFSFDNQFRSPVHSGVSIRRVLRGNNGYETQLIDTTPNTPTFNDAPLAVGRSFVDAAHGVTITTLSANPMFGARVRIQISR
ncbi:MAG: hypothetical protein M3209_17360 [Acidobacteriota bacterium]|nr:hypothetical protein [Acidobacteriota bacterium]